MGPRFKSSFLFFSLFLAASPVGHTAAPAADTEQNSEALEMIANRMRSLTQSLENMPKPPEFNQEIHLPGPVLKIPEKNNNNEKEKQ